MKTEYGEVEEPIPAGTVGSSTMPQKRNPQLCQDVVGITAEIRAQVPLALEAMLNEHEADHTPSTMVRRPGPRLRPHRSGTGTDRPDRLRPGAQPERMRANLDLFGGMMITAEAVMLELGTALGRQVAHEIVYEAAQSAATTGTAFPDLLAADPRITDHLTPDTIKAFLEPATHTGRSASLACAAAERGRAAATGTRTYLEIHGLTGAQAGQDEGEKPKPSAISRTGRRGVRAAQRIETRPPPAQAPTGRGVPGAAAGRTATARPAARFDPGRPRGGAVRPGRGAGRPSGRGRCRAAGPRARVVRNARSSAPGQ